MPELNMTVVLLVAALAGLAIIIAGLALLYGLGRKKQIDSDAGLAENLGEYPPAPAPGTQRLLFEGRPVRVRLVVLAPAGRNVNLTAEMADSVLDLVLYGLSEVTAADKPRVRIWPGQLSQEGFIPKFFKNVARPEGAGQSSPWTLVAGPARAGINTVLLGLALETADPTPRGNVRLRTDHWTDKFRVQKSG